MGRFQATPTLAVHVRSDLSSRTNVGGLPSPDRKSLFNFSKIVDSRQSFNSTPLEQIVSAPKTHPIVAVISPPDQFDAISAPESKVKPSAPSRSTARRSAKATPPEIPESDLLAAVESLYYDQLKPYGRILRKRLTDRGVAAGLASGEAGLVHLRSACSKSAWLKIEPAQGGEWTALLIGCEPKFVDVYSPVDIYPESMWQAATSYFEQVTGPDAILPGGRFSCAQCLVDRRLPFFHRYSLGSVCHIVQLAISQKKILGYSNDGITPYARSQSMLKDVAAKQKSTFSCGQGDDGAGELPFATWNVVRSCIKEALTGDDDVPSPVPLSNIKRLFRTRFNTELSETALGHSKLSELLQDIHLNGICTVKLLDQGYFVIPLFKCDKEEDTDVPSNDSASEASGSCQEDARSLLNTVEWTVRNTFVHVSPAAQELPHSKSLSELEKSSSFLESLAFGGDIDMQQRITFCVDEPLERNECSSTTLLDKSRRVVHLSEFV